MSAPRTPPASLEPRPCPKCQHPQELMHGGIRAAIPTRDRLRWSIDGLPVCVNPQCGASPLFTRA